MNNKNLLNPGCAVPYYLHKEKQVKYYGDFFVKIALSEDGKRWEYPECIVLGPKDDCFDYNPLTVMGSVLTTAGVLVIYDSSWHTNNVVHLRVGMALFDPDEPAKLLWRSETPIYQSEYKTKEIVTPDKAIQEGEELVLSWVTDHSNIFEVRIPHPYLYLGGSKKNKSALDKIKQKFNIGRHKNNPIIEPLSENKWESKATFNPAALYAGGRVHLIYRAIGDDDVSVLGYVSSENGFDIEERLSSPVYFGNRKNKEFLKKYRSRKSPISYISGGGGEGGCEDPRLTLVDDTVYLTYTAFDGWSSLRVGMSSIKLDDFLNKRWNWRKEMLISPADERHKNWVVFPEKINGKFALLHNIHGEDPAVVRVEYLDSLEEKDFEEASFKSPDPNALPSKRVAWHNRMRSIGPPPVKTDFGWLILYHATEESESHRYKMGAMLLDLKDPTKVLHRAIVPVLEPDESYENDGWKAGVLYCCGAVVKGDDLLIYYGGADTVSCVAKTNLNEFVNRLIETENPKIKIKKKVKSKK